MLTIDGPHGTVTPQHRSTEMSSLAAGRALDGLGETVWQNGKSGGGSTQSCNWKVNARSLNE